MKNHLLVVQLSFFSQTQTKNSFFALVIYLQIVQMVVSHLNPWQTVSLCKLVIKNEKKSIKI